MEDGLRMPVGSRCASGIGDLRAVHILSESPLRTGEMRVGILDMQAAVEGICPALARADVSGWSFRYHRSNCKLIEIHTATIQCRSFEKRANKTCSNEAST